MVAQPGLCRTWSETPKTGFLRTRLISYFFLTISQDACISKHVREAIRKEKLEREYKQHQMNVLGHVKQQSRRNQKFQSQQSRYKITAKHRAIDLDLLDQTKQEIEGTKVDSDKFSGNKDDKLKSTETDEIHSCARVNKDTNDVTSKNTERRVQGGIEKDVNIECECERTKSCKCKPSSDLNTNQIEEPRISGGDEVMPKGNHKNSGKENDARLENKEGNGESLPKGAKEKMFCLVDVEAESENTVSYDTLVRPNKSVSAVRVTCHKKLGRVGREFFFSRFFFILKNVYQFSQVTIFSPVTHLSAVLN